LEYSSLVGNDLTVKDDRSHDGKALASLSDQQRAFVLRLMELGPTKKAAAKAATDVGFSQWNGYKLMRDERILAAIHEESAKQLAGGVLIGVKRLIEIAQDKEHRDSYKAAKELAAMNGFSAEQRIVVEHVSTDTREQIRQIRAMAIELGLNPEQLIKSAGIVEAEFTEVEDDS
jgi:hypothetical protein